MAQSTLICYSLIAGALSLVDFSFALKSFKKTGRLGKSLGWSAFFAGVITLAYLASVNTRNPALVSLFSSFTFSGIDCMLVCLLYFCFLVTGFYGKKGSRAVNTVIRLLASLDILVMLANIFTGRAVSFELLDPVGVSYRMNAPYIIHLVFTYVMVALSLLVLVRKGVKTPRQYRNQYLLLIAAIGMVVAFNAVFLFYDRGSFLTKIDCSVLGYSIGLYLMYWTAYDYRENDMLNSLSTLVVRNVSQGVVLFDYADELIMYNERARALLGGVALEEGMACADFLDACGIAPRTEDEYSTQCDIEGCVPLRCDFRRLVDRNRAIGSLYAFTDISRDKDITTGFEYMKDARFAVENAAAFPEPTAVAMFDIIGLKDVNRTLGRDEGDKRIRALAKAMVRQMPAGTVFRRGIEAYLIAFCPGLTEVDIAPNVAAVSGACVGTTMYGVSDTAVRTPSQAIEEALRSIQIKKLLSAESTRSQSLASLVRALKEADADTEDHVRRTQKMGAALGARIGLTDAQLTQLELLCLLHDIGKIGIPLEILNKPGKLSDLEWEALRTHPEKGYQIAMSSDELKPIAEMILDHHERWDGKGYPKGLAGEEIPVLSRIIAVVDAYDAMVNDRSYRKALKPEVAQAEIRENAGTQFDPALAREFLAMLDETPSLALGEKVGSEESREAERPSVEAGGTGYTAPIAYSRYLLDINDVIIEIDARFEEITGYSSADVVGKMAQIELVPKEDRAYYLVQLSNQFTHGDMAYLRHEIQRKDGERVQVACYGKRYFDSAAKTFRNEIIIFRL